MAINNIYLQLLSKDDADSKLADMAASVALQNFDYRYATLLLINSTVYYSVELFLRVFNYNIIINNGIISSKLAKVTEQYVLFGNDVTELEQVLITLSELHMKNTGKFIIVCQSQELHDCDEQEMINLCWEYKIVDVLFITSKEEQVFGYTYFPISNGVCNNAKPIKLKSSNCSQYVTVNHRKIFGRKMMKLSFCPLFVTTFIQSPYMNFTNGKPIGSDGDLLRIIAYGLNTTLEIMTPHRGAGWGFRLKNGTWMGSLADINDDLANISMTSPALTLTRFSDFQMSRSYYTIHVVWITHPAMLENQAFKLLRPFEQSTRIALIASYVVVILCAYVFKTEKWSSICCTTQEDKPLKSVLFYSWMICTGQALVKLPTKSFMLYITFLWIYYCFIIRTMYQVYLISSLRGNFYEDQFETIEDALNANYSFGGGAALQDYYIDYPAIYDNWVNVDASEVIPTLFDISKGKKFVLAMNWATAKLVIKEHKISLHVLPHKVITSPTVIFLKQYSPLTEAVNLVLSRLITSGFPEMLHKKYTFYKAKDNTHENEEEALKIVHFTACYVLLILGWILSAIFFLLEFYFGKIYKHPIFLSRCDIFK